MTEVVIRRAVATDADAVRDLVQLAYAKYVPRMRRRPAPMDHDYRAVLQDTDSWVAELGARLAGVVVTRPAIDHLLVENLAVAPDAQGTGIGPRLLDTAEQHAIASGLAEVRLYTNELMTENLAFYPRHGYRETGRAEQSGFRRVLFSKPVH